jgi:hypothetical protein
MSYAVQRTIGKDYLLKNYGLLGLGAMRGAHPHDRVLKNYPLLGVGQDEEVSSDGAGGCASADSVMVNGVCRDKSVLCGPGTQWVDADKGCVPLTKYMSAAQIAAAVKAGVDLTGGGAVPLVPQQQVITKAAPRVSPAGPTAPTKPMVASFFSGPAAPWVMGAVALGIVGLAYASHKKASHRGQHASR